MPNSCMAHDPPSDPHEIRQFNNRLWNFCTHCGRNGRWVCTHTDATHRSGDDRQRLAYDSRESYQTSHGQSPDRYRSHYRNYDSVSRHNHTNTGLRGRWEARSRSQSPYPSRSSSPNPQNTRHVSFRPPTPNQPQAQLSLLESISNFIGQD
jgi:hypothetical protein